MNGIEKVIAYIEAESAAEIAAVRSEADAAIAELDARYDASAEVECARILAAGAVEAERLVERSNSSAAMTAKQMVLAAKQELIAEAFAAAEAKLLALPEERCAAFLAKLSADAAITGSESLVFNASDSERYGEAVVRAANQLLAADNRTAKLTLSPNPREISGGVIISGGSVEANCSIEALLSQRKNELAVLAAKLLFG